MKFASGKGSGITLTDNEMKYIMKVIKCLANRGIVLKETTKNSIGQVFKFSQTINDSWFTIDEK